jgi:hypothetical protein
MLPFLKNRKTPRIATEPQEEKLVNGSQDDLINEHMLTELMEACTNKDVKLFRQALEGLIMNMLDMDSQGDNDAVDEE